MVKCEKYWWGRTWLVKVTQVGCTTKTWVEYPTHECNNSDLAPLRSLRRQHSSAKLSESCGQHYKNYVFLRSSEDTITRTAGDIPQLTRSRQNARKRKLYRVHCCLPPLSTRGKCHGPIDQRRQRQWKRVEDEPTFHWNNFHLLKFVGLNPQQHFPVVDEIRLSFDQQPRLQI